MSRIASDNNQVMTYKDMSGNEMKLSFSIIKNYLTDNPNVTQQEMSYFMSLCKARQLNPFIKDAYLVKYGSNSAQIIVSKDALEKRALKNENYDGKKTGITVKLPNGNIERRNGSIYDKDSEKLLGAWCEVYRKDWKYPAIAEVNLDEYLQYTKDGKVNSMWSNKPVTMITKVAKAQALREAFIEELQGMYNEEEIDITETDNNANVNVNVGPTYNEQSTNDIETVNDEPEIVDDIF